MTRGEFAHKLLLELGAPKTLHNRRALAAQMQAEGGAAAFNPFNTTQDEPGATNYNRVGVKNYVSADQGVAATAGTLRQPPYADVLSALRANRPARWTVAAIGRSPWGTSSTLLKQVLAWIARVPVVLRYLERRPVAQ